MRLRRIEEGKTSSESEAYHIALEAMRTLNLDSVRGKMSFISSAPGKIKKPESLGEPPGGNNENTLSRCPSKIGNQLCAFKLSLPLIPAHEAVGIVEDRREGCQLLVLQE